MQRCAISTIALVAILSTSLAASTEPAPQPVIAQRPQVPTPELPPLKFPEFSQIPAPFSQFPQVATPELPLSKFLELPPLKFPEFSQVATPELPLSKFLELPPLKFPEFPQVPTPELPLSKFLELPPLKFPEFPQEPTPELSPSKFLELPPLKFPEFQDLSIPQLRQVSIPIPSANVDLDDTARVQARALLDEVVSKYPTLIDSIASLLNTQSFLSTPGLMQTLRSPDLPQLPSLPGSPGMGTQSGSDSPLSTAVDLVLSNLRGFASSPLQFPPLRLTSRGGTPINTSRGLQLPKMMVPLVLNFPNKEGLSPEELSESIKKKIREQSPSTVDSSLNAMVSLDPLMVTHVVDVQPLPPPKENVKKDSSNKPFRRTVPGSFLTGNTDVQIFWEDPDAIKPVEENTDNVRLDLTNAKSNLVPVTYPQGRKS